MLLTARRAALVNGRADLRGVGMVRLLGEVSDARRPQ
jgi:hypothetical protein